MEAYVLLKNLVVGISCFIVLCKFLEMKKLKKEHYFSCAIIVVSVFLHNTFWPFEQYELYTSVLLLIIINLIIFKPLKLKYLNSLTFLTVSYAASILISLICGGIVSFAYALIFGYKFYVSMAFLIELLIIIVSIAIYKIRFKFVINNVKTFRGICFSIFGMMLNTYILSRIINVINDGTQIVVYHDNEILWAVSIGLITYGLFTILKRETMQAYSEKALKHKMNKISTDFNSLMLTHDFLSDRVHKDAKYLRAFDKALTILLHETPDADVKLKAQKVMDDITEFKKAMQIETQQYNEDTTYDISGMILLDSIMISMLDLAKGKGIDLGIEFNEPPGSVTKYITEEQLSTLIADLLENAIIAVDNSPNMNKKIRCSICLDESGIIQIVIMDSGVAFDKSVLCSIGKKKITTYKEAGGSGEGLWNVYKTMRSSKASLTINETIHDLDFTKSITIRFDGECEYKYCHNSDSSRNKNPPMLTDG
ncbi:MAG TPA: hypothetical protein DEB10_13155 [Ruminococcaceae bacterium]|nr:hypothetical protein [Oscillospiraceae bacterium]